MWLRTDEDPDAELLALAQTEVDGEERHRWPGGRAEPPRAPDGASARRRAADRGEVDQRQAGVEGPVRSLLLRQRGLWSAAS